MMMACRSLSASASSIKFLFSDPFNPGVVSDFTGSKWGGVELEETTRDDFKSRFKTKGGKFIRPEALIVDTPSSAPWEMQALLDGTNGRSRITGFYLSYPHRMPPLDQFERDLSPAEKWYLKTRYSDWYVAAYPARGIAFMVVRAGDETIPFALLTTGSRLKRMLQAMIRDQTPVQDIRRDFDRLDRAVEVGTVTVTFSQKDLAIRNEDILLNVLRASAPRAIASDSIRYAERGQGDVAVSIYISFRDGKNDNNVRVLAQLNGSNERGRVSVVGTGLASLDSSQSKASRLLGLSIDSAYRMAVESMKKAAGRKINGQKPTSPEDYRAAAFVKLLAEATK